MDDILGYKKRHGGRLQLRTRKIEGNIRVSRGQHRPKLGEKGRCTALTQRGNGEGRNRSKYSGFLNQGGELKQ